MTACRYTAPLPPPRFNLTRYCLEAATRRHPAKAALIIATDPGDPAHCIRITYAELEERSNRLANHLREVGVGPGDHIGIYCYNRPEYLDDQ